MINQIGPLRIGFLTEIGNAIALSDRINGLLRTRQPDHARVEVGDEFFHDGRRITRRVESDEDRRDFCRSFRIGLLKSNQAFGNVSHVCRADIGAKGIAKIDEPVFARKVRIGDGLAVLIDEAEGAAHLGPLQWRGTSAGRQDRNGKGSGEDLEFVHGPDSFALLRGGVQGTIYPHILGRTDMKKFIATILAAVLLWPAVASAQFSDGYTFLKAVRDRDGAKATEILNKPGNVIVDTKDVSSGESALHIVTKRRDTTWLSFLLAKGAKPDTKDADGNTPLILATQVGYAEGADMLLKRRASVDAINSRGETSLIVATQKRDVAMVRLLLAAGANPRRTDRAAGMSAMDYAARDSRAAVILKLLQDAKPAKAAAGPV